MEKLLRPRDKILLGLSLLGDIYFTIAEPLGITIRKIHGILPPDYKASNFYNILYRSLKTGEINKVIKAGKVFYELTSMGRKSIKRQFPLFSLQQKRWDGLWRIVIFDIKEKNRTIRNILRKKLKSLSFGMWQESVYITPFNVAEDMKDFLSSKGLINEVCILVAKHLFAGDIKKLVSRIWQLDILNNQYEELMDRWEWSKGNLKKDKLKIEARRCYSQYVDLISQDPCLPLELLPANWWGVDVRKLVKEWIILLD